MSTFDRLSITLPDFEETHLFDDGILDQIFEPSNLDSQDDASAHGFDSTDAFNSSLLGDDECTVVSHSTNATFASHASNSTHASSSQSSQQKAEATDFATTMRQFRGSFPSHDAPALSYNQCMTNATFHRSVSITSNGSNTQRRPTKRQSKKRARSNSAQLPLQAVPYNPQGLGIFAIPMPAPKKVVLPPAPYDPSVIVAAMEAHESAPKRTVPPRKRAKKASRRCSVTKFNLKNNSTTSSDDEDLENTPGYQLSLQKLADSMKRTELSRRQLMMQRSSLGLNQVQPSVPVLPQRTVSPEPPSSPTAEDAKESIRNAFFAGSRVTLTDGLEQSRRELRRNSIVLNRWSE